MERQDLFDSVKADLEIGKREGRVAAFSIVEGEIPIVRIRTVGKNVDSDWISQLERRLGRHGIVDYRHYERTYYLLSQEARPGSSIVRVAGGVPEGPAGTLTCFLSSEDGRDLYFAAAGHVVSDFWNVTAEDPKGSIYHNPKGFPATNSTRFMGKLCFLAHPPPEVCAPTDREATDVNIDIDIGIVSLKGDFEWKQRTTCYGTFGEWRKARPGKPKKCRIVMKCGAEEPHWTYAYVEKECEPVLVYGPKNHVYELRGQVILQQIDSPEQEICNESSAGNRYELPYPKTNFAIPGDSGAMVVDYKSRRPLGMLIAGSILDGKYVMTPIRAIWQYWTDRHLLLLRA
jgi:hypothetical protein